MSVYMANQWPSKYKRREKIENGSDKIDLMQKMLFVCVSV
jgi:hypothetical protein